MRVQGHGEEVKEEGVGGSGEGCGKAEEQVKRNLLEQRQKFPEGICNREGVKREDEAEGAGAVQAPD